MIGLLQHAASKVVSGRPFLRHLIILSKTMKHLHYMVCLNLTAISDILWWHMFMSTWNGLACLPFHCPQVHNVSLTSDAMGSWGCGPFWDSQWFQLEWTGQMRFLSITFMDLLPINLTAAIWGPKWQSCQVICHCDSEAGGTVINKGSTKDRGLAQLLRCISFYCAYFHFTLHAQHVSACHNQTTDALSRNTLQLFFSLCPQARPTPDPIPQEVIKMAMITKAKWTSPVWRALFRATLPKD